MTLPTAKPCRTLIVEDHAPTRRALGKLLAFLGHDVETAATVAEGLEKLSWGPGCMLLDLMLPDGNGLAILAYIRSQELPIKVAVTSAVYDVEMRNKVESLHPDAIFDKPVDVTELSGWLSDD